MRTRSSVLPRIVALTLKWCGGECEWWIGRNTSASSRLRALRFLRRLSATGAVFPSLLRVRSEDFWRLRMPAATISDFELKGNHARFYHSDPCPDAACPGAHVRCGGRAILDERESCG